MEYVKGTFLTEPGYVQEQLSTLTLRPSSGMGNLIQEMKDGLHSDCRILYLRMGDGTIVAWLTMTDKPRWWGNLKVDKPEIQIYVKPEVRRQGIGRSLLSQARTLWGAFSTCPWSDEAAEFFKSTR